MKIGIVTVVGAAVVAAVVARQVKLRSSGRTIEGAPVSVQGALPRLVDLGADKCIPCKMMAPVLAELKKDYAGRLQVDFIDVWKFPDAANPYGIEVIPTQIFYDAEGKELFRHVGFFSKQDILSKWRELGIDLSATPTAGQKGASRVIAYYFHKTVRCDACLVIEAQARSLIERQFSAEVGARRLVFAPVNYELPQNAHYATDYKLPCPSLVLVREQDGKQQGWQLLGDTWNLVSDAGKFNQYVETEVGKFLADAK